MEAQMFTQEQKERLKRRTACFLNTMIRIFNDEHVIAIIEAIIGHLNQEKVYRTLVAENYRQQWLDEEKEEEDG
jgi:flagellar biosynthesis regulator FlbT